MIQVTDKAFEVIEKSTAKASDAIRIFISSYG